MLNALNKKAELYGKDDSAMRSIFYRPMGALKIFESP